jgi:hypothetical protein
VSYPVLLTLHLIAALIFVGTVFFEVLMLEAVRSRVSPAAMREMESAIGARARALMPWVLLVLYLAGAGMAWHHRAALTDPFGSSFASLLTIKIVLALVVLGHFVAAMTLMRRGLMRARHSRFIHLSVFTLVIGIVILAKAMFYLHW